MKAILQASLARGAIGRRNIVLVVSSAEFAILGGGDWLALFGAAKVNRFTLTDENDDQSRKLSDMRVLDRVASFVKDQNTTEILLALPWNDEERLDCIREALKKLPVAVRLLGDSRVRSLTNFSSSGQSNVLSIDIQGPPLTLTERMVKRLMDICISSFAVIFFSPVFLITAIAIKLDGPGPVIFRQYRKGFNGKQFLMYKFRTMTVLENGTDVPQAKRNDPRITKIGKLLRATSIDELPQLLNVLRGEMSVIGPRPHALAHDTYFENALSEYAFRRHVKPGITGWAQCNGSRGATPSVDDVSARVKLDLWYINNWSLLLDVRILMKTVFEVLRRRNAY
jgi:undecaprenyl-phosphate galactose phosphotransferase/putative colanic acid biosynthesis UDP-glucose lipid carrier transferase